MLDDNGESALAGNAHGELQMDEGLSVPLENSASRHNDIEDIGMGSGECEEVI